MSPDDYIKEAVQTSASRHFPTKDRVLHAGIGLATEAGEILDALKKAMYYEQELDLVNIKEEVGDILWYIAELCDGCNWSLEEVMQLNIAKLRKRYPDKFTTFDAANRDLEAERKVLEDELWYLQDTRKFEGNSLLWWKADNAGYTSNIDEARVWTSAERRDRDANSIEDNKRWWPKSKVDRVVTHRVTQASLVGDEWL